MENKKEIINLVLRNPSSPHNINQISRTLKISVGSAHKIIKELEKKGVVRSTKLGNAIYYRLNFNKETIKITSLILAEQKQITFQSPLIKLYGKEIEKIKAKIIILFGSILEKKEKAGDIDVLFIIPKKEDAKRIYHKCSEISMLKTKQIVPLILTEKDLKEKIEKQEKLILDIIKKGVVLFGEENFIKTISRIKWQI
jgi:DNA-binding Lrp family transcriptional regulator